MSSKRLKFFVGLNTGYVTDGLPDQRYVEFYRKRSSALLHCAILGNVVIPGGVGSNPNTPAISQSPIWADLASVIAGNGTKPGIQLATAWEGYVGSRRFRSSESTKTIAQNRQLLDDLGSRKIVSALDAMLTATDLALGAGFRHLQLHAAHGYLFNLLIDCRINPKADYVLKRLEAWALTYVNSEVETSIRISIRTGDHEFDAVGRDHFHRNIVSLPFDFFDLSSGFYNIDKQLIYPGRPDHLAIRRSDTIEIAREFPEKQFIFSGRALLDPDNDLPPNVHIGLCRDLIANHEYLTDFSNGCVNAGRCHYFSRGEQHVTCAQWPEASKNH